MFTNKVVFSTFEDIFKWSITSASSENKIDFEDLLLFFCKVYFLSLTITLKLPKIVSVLYFVSFLRFLIEGAFHTNKEDLMTKKKLIQIQ